MFPVIVIQAIGGILVAATMFSSGLANVNNKIQERQKENQIEIDEELDELKDDYIYCEDIYFKNLIYEGEIEEELSKEEYDDYRYDFAESYSSEYHNRINIQDKTLQYMRKHLPKDVQEKFKQREKYREVEDRSIINQWIRSKIHKVGD